MEGLPSNQTAGQQRCVVVDVVELITADSSPSVIPGAFLLEIAFLGGAHENAKAGIGERQSEWGEAYYGLVTFNRM